MKNNHWFMAVLVIFLTACSSVQQPEVVLNAHNLKLITPSQPLPIPANTQVIALGETHYVSEHAQFIASQMPYWTELGFRKFVFECNAALSVPLNDYVHGRLDAIAEDPLYSVELPIAQVIRQWNESQPLERQWDFVAIDINHQPETFNAYVLALANRAPWQQWFAQNQINLHQPKVFKTLAEQLAVSSAKPEAIDTNEWQQFLWQTDFALRGDKLNFLFWSLRREKLMIESIAKQVGDAPYVLNVGMNHAQKSSHWSYGTGTYYTLIGEWLNATTPTYHIAFHAWQGTKRWRFRGPTFEYDKGEELKESDLLYWMHQQSQSRLSYVDLSEPEFKHVWRLDDYRQRPGHHFDALVLYPESTVYPSLEKHFP